MSVYFHVLCPWRIVTNLMKKKARLADLIGQGIPNLMEKHFHI